MYKFEKFTVLTILMFKLKLVARLFHIDDDDDVKRVRFYNWNKI